MMFHNLYRLMVAASVMMMATGCSISMKDCDPSVDPGFFQKLGCAATGTYNQRIEYKQRQLEKLQATNTELHDILNSLSSEQKMLSMNKSERVAEMSELQRKLNTMKTNLKNQKALSSDLEKKFNDYNKAIEDVKNLSDDSSDLEKQSSRDKLVQEGDELLNMMVAE